MGQPNIHFISLDESPLDMAAAHIILHTSGLPDLAGTQIILDDIANAPSLRRSLLTLAGANGYSALLGPEILTLEQWLHTYTPGDVAICPEQARLLILVEALYNAPKLLGQANAWSLADSLLGLFDELTLNRISIHEELDAFANKLARWYSLNHTEFYGLQHEAALVHQLWHAWHTQLQAQGLVDPVTVRIQAMQNSLQSQHARVEQHFIGIEPTSYSETEWIKGLASQSSNHIWLHGNPRNQQNLADQGILEFIEKTGWQIDSDRKPNDYEHVLHTVFDTERQLIDRAAAVRESIPRSPLTERLKLFSAHNAEQEAHAIDLQVRQWLLQGKAPIGIVTENRRLARRVRAILERADVLLQDGAGWTLSTTRAASCIESLMLCIEDDFASDSLLDLLKSPFLFPDTESETLKKLTYRLEHDIINNEGIASHLQRYKNGILDRVERLTDIWPVNPANVIELLDRIDEASKPLQAIYKGRNASLLSALQALLQSLHALGIYAAMQDDAAGLRILQMLDNMHNAGEGHSFETNWQGFRAWLGRNMETHYFRPASSGGPVVLCSLKQAIPQKFDALVIAGVEQDYLPGAPTRSPFFNDAVRQQLGLTTRRTMNRTRLYQFYRLLFAAPSILLTHRQEEDGEPIAESPWLSAIRTFHEHTYDDDLQNTHLHTLLQTGKTEVIRCDTLQLPGKQQRPEPAAHGNQLPHAISATAYQQLLNCPYQFFAARCLELKPPEEIQKVLSKKEYGERVHLCLQAFHSNLERYPGPFEQQLTGSNRDAAIQLMLEITDAVFQFDLKDNYTHRGWYHQWREVIPAYIDWQVDRNQTIKVYAVEAAKEITFDESLRIKGRLDRIDSDADGLYVLDYKTGSTPRKYEIQNGEKIQLPFYALLCKDEPLSVKQVEYLQLGQSGQFKAVFPQAGDELEELAEKIGTRLQDIMHRLHNGHSLPAWETNESCKHCDMTNLCRMGSWNDE
jgi:ATP-dependent helicase/nuclease subunit B